MFQKNFYHRVHHFLHWIEIFDTANGSAQKQLQKCNMLEISSGLKYLLKDRKMLFCYKWPSAGYFSWRLSVHRCMQELGWCDDLMLCCSGLSCPLDVEYYVISGWTLGIRPDIGALPPKFSYLLCPRHCTALYFPLVQTFIWLLIKHITDYLNACINTSREQIT